MLKLAKITFTAHHISKHQTLLQSQGSIVHRVDRAAKPRCPRSTLSHCAQPSSYGFTRCLLIYRVSLFILTLLPISTEFESLAGHISTTLNGTEFFLWSQVVKHCISFMVQCQQLRTWHLQEDGLDFKYRIGFVFN